MQHSQPQPFGAFFVAQYITVLMMATIVWMIATSNEPRAIEPALVVHARQRDATVENIGSSPSSAKYQEATTPEAVVNTVLMITCVPQKKLRIHKRLTTQ